MAAAVKANPAIAFAVCPDPQCDALRHCAAGQEDRGLLSQKPGNVCLDQQVGDTVAVEAAFAGAAHVTRLEATSNRLVGNAMEPRSAVAAYDSASESFELVSGSQGVNVMRNILAKSVFNVAPSCPGFLGHSSERQQRRILN